MMIHCLRYHALAAKQFPTDLKDAFSIVVLAVCWNGEFALIITSTFPSKTVDTECIGLSCVEMRCLLVTTCLFVCLHAERKKLVFFPAIKLKFDTHFSIGNTCF